MNNKNNGRKSGLFRYQKTYVGYKVATVYRNNDDITETFVFNKTARMRYEDINQDMARSRSYPYICLSNNTVRHIGHKD